MIYNNIKRLTAFASAAITVLLIQNQVTATAWDYTGSLGTGRIYTTATTLGNGKVLIAAGNNSGNSIASSELYDPSTGTWSSTGSLGTARQRHTATLLSNGKVLVAGGRTTLGVAHSSAELYDPTSGTWAATGSMTGAREYHTATLLADGKVLVAGGVSGSTNLSTCEIYNPATGTWATTGSLPAVRSRFSAVLLSNGKVLAAGGYGASGTTATAALFNPSTGTWASTGSLSGSRADFALVTLPTGKILAAGGVYNNGSDTIIGTAELYTVSSGTWASTGSLVTARRHPQAAVLNNGRVLITAGSGSGGTLTSTELYNTTSGTWTGSADLNAARTSHRMVILGDGRPLVVGGGSSAGYLASAEVYDGACINVLTWQFTDEGFITGGQSGGYRAYSNPAAVAASPWSFQSADKDSLRIAFEDDGNCQGYNGYTQTGTATAELEVTCETRLYVSWSGMGETQDAGYELMSFTINDGLSDDLVGEAHAPGGSQGCAPMGPVVSNPTPPQYRDLSPGTYLIKIEATTADALFHHEAYYQFNLSFEPL